MIDLVMVPVMPVILLASAIQMVSILLRNWIYGKFFFTRPFVAHDNLFKFGQLMTKIAFICSGICCIWNFGNYLAIESDYGQYSVGYIPETGYVSAAGMWFRQFKSEYSWGFILLFIWSLPFLVVFVNFFFEFHRKIENAVKPKEELVDKSVGNYISEKGVLDWIRYSAKNDVVVHYFADGNIPNIAWKWDKLLLSFGRNLHVIQNERLLEVECIKGLIQGNNAKNSEMNKFASSPSYVWSFSNAYSEIFFKNMLTSTAKDFAVPLRMILENANRFLKRIIEHEQNAGSVPVEVDSEEGNDIQNKIRLSNINTNPLVKPDWVLSAVQLPEGVRSEMPVKGRGKKSEDFKFPDSYVKSPNLPVTENFVGAFRFDSYGPGQYLPRPDSFIDPESIVLVKRDSLGDCELK